MCLYHLHVLHTHNCGSSRKHLPVSYYCSNLICYKEGTVYFSPLAVTDKGWEAGYEASGVGELTRHSSHNTCQLVTTVTITLTLICYKEGTVFFSPLAVTDKGWEAGYEASRVGELTRYSSHNTCQLVTTVTITLTLICYKEGTVFFFLLAVTDKGWEAGYEASRVGELINQTFVPLFMRIWAQDL